MKHIHLREVSMLLNSAKTSYANTLGLIERANQIIKSKGLDIEVVMDSYGNICGLDPKAKKGSEMLMTEDELNEYIKKAGGGEMTFLEYYKQQFKDVKKVWALTRKDKKWLAFVITMLCLFNPFIVCMMYLYDTGKMKVDKRFYKK